MCPRSDLNSNLLHSVQHHDIARVMPCRLHRVVHSDLEPTDRSLLRYGCRSVNYGPQLQLLRHPGPARNISARNYLLTGTGLCNNMCCGVFCTNQGDGAILTTFVYDADKNAGRARYNRACATALNRCRGRWTTTPVTDTLSNRHKMRTWSMPSDVA